MKFPWQNHPWAGSTEQEGTDTPAQVCCSLPGTQESVPPQESSPASTRNFPDIYHIFHTSSSTGAVSVVQHLQVWRDQAKSAVRSFLGIVLLRNEGKRGARILSQCSTTHVTECSLCSSQTHCASQMEKGDLRWYLNSERSKAVPKPPNYTVTNWLMPKCSMYKKEKKKFTIIFNFSDSQPSGLNPLDADIPVRTNTSHHSCLISLI